MSRYQIRVPKTELGTVWIEAYEFNKLYITPWWHHTCRLEGEPIPFFRCELTRTAGEWAFTELTEAAAYNAPEWPRGALKKLPAIALKIGSAWAVENEDVIREKASLYLAHRVKYMGSTSRLDLIRECIDDAVVLDRLDLLEPIRPLLKAIANEFSQVNRGIAARSRRSQQREAA